MRCLICGDRLGKLSTGAICSEICAEELFRRERRELILASERRARQCQVCSDEYSAPHGCGEFCSPRCRQVVWGSWVA